MTSPKRGEIVHACAHGACYEIRVLDNFVWEPWHWPKDCPALKQETVCGNCLSGECHVHGKPQEPKAEEWILHLWDNGAGHVNCTRPSGARAIGCNATRFVEVHNSQACQRERERLRGLIRHSLLLSPPNFDPMACFQCREIEEALK